MNTATAESKRRGIPLLSGLRGRIIILAAVFAVTLSVVTQAKAYYDEFAFWNWEGYGWTTPAGTCYWSLRERGEVDVWSQSTWSIRSTASHAYGWGGTPWCDQTAAKAWAQNSGGTWVSSSWVTVGMGYNAVAVLYATNGYGGVEGQYQANYGGYWTTYFQWSPAYYY